MTIKRAEEQLDKLTRNRPFIRAGKLKDRTITMFDSHGDVVAQLRFSKDDDAVEITPTRLSKARDCCNILDTWFRDQQLRTVINFAG